MKLIVMIPAFNEEENIGKVIKEIPRQIEGVSRVEVLVIDDGSTDNTIEVAKNSMADHIIVNPVNSGLAYTFQRGIDYALYLGADIIVNTDGDYQYNQQEIPKLIQPILEGGADIVSGNRQIEKLNHMIYAKKYGNMLGTKFVEKIAGYKIKDASSGFRAYSKEAALKLFVTSNHTYTHQTLIQAFYKKLKVIEIPVEFRKREGRSKLIKSIFSHVKKSSSTIVRTSLMYNALKILTYLGLFFILLGSVPIIRWLILNYFFHTKGQYIQSVILGTILIIFGGLAITLGIISDLIATNRRYLEEILYKINKKNQKDK